MVSSEQEMGGETVAGRLQAQPNGAEKRSPLARGEQGGILKKKEKGAKANDEIDGKKEEFSPRVIEAPPEACRRPWLAGGASRVKMQADGGMGALPHIPKYLGGEVSPKETMRRSPKIAGEDMMGRKT